MRQAVDVEYDRKIKCTPGFAGLQYKTDALSYRNVVKLC